MRNKSSSSWRDRHWDAYLAHQAVAREVRAGRLVPGPCQECGADPAVGHHDSYADRLTVRWLCQSHHRIYHLEHPAPEVPAPPHAAKPVAEREQTRGRRFHHYLKPMALRRHEEGLGYRAIAEELGVAPSTVFKWVKNPNYR